MSGPADQLAAALAGRYRIDRVIGAGGMAVVYLAEDTKHRRPVAIKVLREELATSVGGARFLREIDIAAQLQHPNILALIDSGDADGLLYFVMPFVDGQSLRELLASGPIPISQAVRLLIEIADALAYAHERGIVHRDIKPDNVMLSGRHALVMDFGVARAVSAATSERRTTTMGVTLGTPTYMSPEQAAADPNVDHRADIYSLGVLGYELLAGRPPFAGPPQNVIAAHITAPLPSLAAARPDVPPAVERAIMKCLAKNPADRWQSAAELMSHLESVVTPEERSVARRTAPTATRTRRRAGVGIATAVVLGFVAWRVTSARRASAPALALGAATQFTTEDGIATQPDFSPDGKSVAFAAGRFGRMRILIRPVSGGRTIPLTDDSTEVQMQPRWSPDGTSILYLAEAGVRVGPAAGGRPRTLIAGHSGDTVLAAAWSPDGQRLAYSRVDTLFVAPITGGSPRAIGAGSDLHSCAWSPRRDLIACVSGNSSGIHPLTFGNIAPSKIVVFPVAGGAPQPLDGPLKAHQSPVWSHDGSVLYFVSDRQGPSDVYVVAIANDGRASGSPARVTTGLGVQFVTLAAGGERLAYSVHAARANVWSMTIPSSSPPSTPIALTALTSGAQVVEGMRLSRDGQWLVYDSNILGHADIYRMRLPNGQPERITNGVDGNFRADLSPNGKEIAFQSFRTGSRDIYVQSVDGGAARAVTNTPAQEAGAVWSPDGQSLLFVDLATPHGLFVVRRQPSGEWNTPVRRSVAGPGGGDWSPDGKWIVIANGGPIRIASSDTGADRVLYDPAPNSADPAAESVAWSRDGSTIYFKAHDADGRASFWSIAATGGRPRLLARLDDLSRPSNRPEFAIDGRRLYFAIQDRQSYLWLAEVNRR